MAVEFPDGLELSLGSAVEDDDGVAIDTTDDGQLALRQLYPQTYYHIDAQWAGLTRDEHASLRYFLSTNRMNELLLTVDGVTYTARQVRALRVIYKRGAGIVDVAARFRGTRNG